MKTTFKKVTIAAAAAYIAMASAAFAGGSHATAQDDVRDTNGASVTSTFGDCVRTKWMVNTDPCGAPSLMRMSREARTVYFDFNSAKLTAESKTKLNNLIKAIRESKQVQNVDIVGFADKIGGKGDYNLKLSKKRAQAVKAYLNAKGYKDTRNVVVKGEGATKSVTECDNSLPRNELIACLAEDRRVEIELNLAK